MMYAFWLTVIVYSMSILVLVYTYQFDKFPLYWTEYLHISDTLQKDIGLETYETKQLFLHLVNPTMIVIITVIQLHYCHRKFLEISEIPEIVRGRNDKLLRADHAGHWKCGQLYLQKQLHLHECYHDDVEYHVSQLVDVCAVDLGQSNLDHAKSAQEYA